MNYRKKQKEQNIYLAFMIWFVLNEKYSFLISKTHIIIWKNYCNSMQQQEPINMAHLFFYDFNIYDFEKHPIET